MLIYSGIILLAVLTAGLLMRLTQQHLPLGRVEKWTIGMGRFCGAMIGG